MPLLPSLVYSTNLTVLNELGPVTGPVVSSNSITAAHMNSVTSQTTLARDWGDNGLFLLPLWLGFYGSITLVDVGTYSDLQAGDAAHRGGQQD